MPASVNSNPAYLLLEDGIFLKGISFGASGTATGEICFNTGMTGYQEVFSDPSYYGQVLIMNNVHIGNYGVYEKDMESSSAKIKALICREPEVGFSRYLASSSLHQHLIEEGVVAIGGIDTRALVSHIRRKGAMNCIISSEISSKEILQSMLTSVPSMAGLELASVVSTPQAYDFGNEGAEFRIAVLDFGVKRSILQCLADRGAHLRVFPAKTSTKELLEYKAQGYFISNGPGDPAPMDYAIRTVREIIDAGKPLFGICLGHQLLSLANGVTTFKMHHGHRGLNHPVKNLLTGKSEITTQNHGFGVDPESVKQNNELEITHVNLNDGSIEGIRLRHKPAFSVQYHPEASPGPHDSRYLFDDFMELIRQNS
jgi:carbamoyl-phosphate synthase small subunit